jgi:hypothetical protein
MLHDCGGIAVPPLFHSRSSKELSGKQGSKLKAGLNLLTKP